MHPGILPAASRTQSEMSCFEASTEADELADKNACLYNTWIAFSLSLRPVQSVLHGVNGSSEFIALQKTRSDLEASLAMSNR